MTVAELMIQLQEYPQEEEVWLCEDFYGEPSHEVYSVGRQETTSTRVVDGKIEVIKIQVLCIK